MNLSTRITKSILWMSLAFGIAGVFVGLIYNRSVFLNSVKGKVEREAYTTGFTILRYYLYGDIIGLKSTLDNLAESNHWCFGRFLDQENNLVWDYSSDNAEICRNQPLTFFMNGLIEQTIPVTRSGEQNAVGHLSIAVPIVGDMKLMSDMLISFFVPFLVFWALFMFVVHFRLKRLISPLRIFANEIRDYASDLNFDLNPIKTNDEIGKLRGLFRELSLKWRESVEQVRQAEADIAIAKVSAQVAHDIRSPLTALNMIQASLEGVPHDQKCLLRAAINRIAEISDNLRSNPISSPSTNFVSIIPLIEGLVREKKIENSGSKTNISLSYKTENLHEVVIASPSELKCIFSNLINNALEALEGKEDGLCQLAISVEDQWVIFELRDNGKGIPQHVLPHLGQRGATFGKFGGSGLGLWGAFNHIKACNGTMNIQSEEGLGTTITIRIPRAVRRPEWTLDELDLRGSKSIIILDDDPSVLESWKRRFAGMPVDLLFFKSPLELTDRIKDLNRDSYRFLIDNDFGKNLPQGIDLIENLALQERAFLVTSSYADTTLLQRVSDSRAKVVPKSCIHSIQISI